MQLISCFMAAGVVGDLILALFFPRNVMPGFQYKVVDDESPSCEPGEVRLSPGSVNNPVYYAGQLHVLLC